jgi:CRP-like cAMP-binding protein
MAALDAAPRSAHVTAAEPTRALALDGADFRALLLTRAAMGRRIIEDLVGRLRRMIAAS